MEIRWVIGDFLFTGRRDLYPPVMIRAPGKAVFPGMITPETFGAISWTDVNGKLWLFGGYGYHTSGLGYLNDLWKYDPVSNNWTWIKGDSISDVLGVYGSQGIAALTNKPGGRTGAVSWIDGS